MAAPDQPPFTSIYANHPDVRNVLPVFISRLPAHVARLRVLHAQGNWPELRALAHQLKGAGQSYGFAAISTFASDLESRIVQQRPGQEIATALAALIDYIQQIDGYRAASAAPPAPPKPTAPGNHPPAP